MRDPDHGEARGSPAEGLLELGFLSEAGSTPSAMTAVPEKPGDFIDRYRLLEPLGMGGFGSVWRAEQVEPIRRELALKLIKAGMDSGEISARFAAERQALALMDHPNIAAVLDAGTTTSGRPYFVMELVKGQPITEYCDRHRLGIPERLALFLPVCQAVQHAHQKSILHRDLKPSNILVATVDGKPQPKIIDFGIAKALGGAEGDASLLNTRMGVIIGTPRYMSPEQAGSMPDVDTRSDVYSLGVILCELLTGQPPFPNQPREVLEALRVLREMEPVRPSVLVQSATPAVVEAACLRHLDPSKLARTLRGDLDWITLKALEKDRARRFETPTALAHDISCYLEQKPVSAAAPTWSYQLGKFARRQRAALIAAVMIALALISGTVVSLWQASRAERNRVEADRNRQEAEAHFAQARDAVDQYLARVSEHPRLRASDFTDLQRELLETALPFYEKMTQYRGGDPKLRKDRAWALWRLAKVYQTIRQLEKAGTTYGEAIQQQEALVTAAPDEVFLQRDLAFQHDEVAYVQRLRGQGAECLASHRRAVQVMEKLLSREPASIDWQHRLGIVRMNHALSLEELKKYDEAQEEYQKADAMLTPLVLKHPGQVKHWSAIGECLGKQGGLFRRMGRLEEAEISLNRAVECQEQAVTVRPRDQACRHHLGNTLSMLGTVLYHRNRAAEAESHLNRAMDLHQGLVREFPSIPLYRNALTEAREVLIYVHAKLGRAKEAEALQELQQAELSRLAAEFPDEKKYQDDVIKIFALQAARAFERKDWFMARDRYQRVAAATGGYLAHFKLAQIALATREPALVVKHAVEFARVAPVVWQNQELAARQLREALAIVRGNADTDPAAREQAATACGDHLINCLQKAASLGFAGMAFFDQDEKSVPLRGRPDYLALLKQTPAPPPRSPVKFQYDYKFDNPGLRVWTREGIVWTETAPGGATGTFTVMGPATVEGIAGSQLEKNGPKRLTLFVPDLGTAAPMHLKMKRADGSWGLLGALQQVE